MYCRMSPFAFSIAPFCHEEYGPAKYTGTPKLLLIISCAANSKPLSVVIVFIRPLKGMSSCFTVSANFLAFLPCFNFLMNSMFVCFSTKVTMAPQLPFPTMVSISKSPKRTPSTSFGLSLTLTRLGMTTRLPPTGLARCFNLYRKVGSATTILENKDNIQDILFTLEMKGIVRTLAGEIYHLLK